MLPLISALDLVRGLISLRFVVCLWMFYFTCVSAEAYAQFWSFTCVSVRGASRSLVAVVRALSVCRFCWFRVFAA